MKILIIPCCIATCILSACGNTNLLTLKSRKTNYFEYSTITNDSVFMLHQRICYNEAGIIDEEFCYDLRLVFADTAAARKKRLLDLGTDTNIVQSAYDVISVWFWGGEKNDVSGQIEILQWNQDKIKLQEDIKVIDNRRKETKRFKGIRTFTCENDK